MSFAKKFNPAKTDWFLIRFVLEGVVLEAGGYGFNGAACSLHNSAAVADDVKAGHNIAAGGRGHIVNHIGAKASINIFSRRNSDHINSIAQILGIGF